MFLKYAYSYIVKSCTKNKILTPIIQCVQANLVVKHNYTSTLFL